MTNTLRHPSQVEKVHVFDMDGVLAYTEMYERAQNQAMLQLYNVIPGTSGPDDIVVSGEFARRTEDRMRTAFFESGGDPVRHYQSLLGRTALGGHFRAWHEYVVNAYKELVFEYPGAVELLRSYVHDETTGIALLTSRERKFVTPDLVRGIIIPGSDDTRREGFFDITITADDVGVTDDGKPRLKPDTAGLEVIAEYYNGISYKDMTMIGDRETDIVPAAKLGARAIGFASGYMKQRQDLLWAAGASDVVLTHEQLQAALTS